MRKKSENKKGFTLAELLIVVAIIAVLIAIAIPVFARNLEQSREAADLANIRAAYAEVVTEYLSNNNTATEATVENIQQTVYGWVTEGKGEDNRPVLYTRVNGEERKVSIPDIDDNYTVTVSVDDNGDVTVTAGTK